MQSLDAHWSSDEARWLERSADFIVAIKQGTFSETHLAYHPGVMTMWFAGLRTFFIEPGVNVVNLAPARWFLGIVVWVGLGVACVLLYRLFGFWISIMSFAFFAYSPFFLAQTRRVHTDALATLFTLLTVLLFLLYCKNHQKHQYLIFSGLTFGLSCLAKSYSVILLGWVPVCLFLSRKSEDKNQKQHLFADIAAVMSFLGWAILTGIVLWPIFWSSAFGILGLSLLCVMIVLLGGLKTFYEQKPIYNEQMQRRFPVSWFRLRRFTFLAVGIVMTLVCANVIDAVWRVFDRVHWAVTTPHEVEHFFLGKVVYDPGWLFYPLVLTIKSTPLMLPLALIGCILLWKRRKHSEETSRQFQMALALIAGVLLFTLCLSATSKKFSRYLLPAFPMLEILAAIGLVQGFKWVSTVLRARFGIQQAALYKNALVVIACVGFFFIQVFPVLARHPYYGTYYNPCWKVTDITKIITVGEASGLDLAAKYLNEKPDARELVVQVSPLATEFVHYYFHGRVYRSDRQTNLSPDYEVVYIRDSQIGRVPQTGTLNGDLEKLITLNGIDHVWIYKVR